MLAHSESFRASVVEAVEDSVEDELDVTVVTGTSWMATALEFMAPLVKPGILRTLKRR